MRSLNAVQSIIGGSFITLSLGLAGSALGEIPRIPPIDPIIVRPLLAPDLVVSGISLRGTPTRVAGGFVKIPLLVTVKNQGQRSASPSKVAVYYKLNGNEYVGAFAVAGQSNIWYPMTETLAPGASKAFRGVLTVRIQNQPKTDLKAEADSCSGDEFMPAYCRVSETSEANNRRTLGNVSIP